MQGIYRTSGSPRLDSQLAMLVLFTPSRSAASRWRSFSSKRPLPGLRLVRGSSGILATGSAVYAFGITKQYPLVGACPLQSLSAVFQSCAAAERGNRSAGGPAEGHLESFSYRGKAAAPVAPACATNAIFWRTTVEDRDLPLKEISSGAPRVTARHSALPVSL